MAHRNAPGVLLSRELAWLGCPRLVNCPGGFVITRASARVPTRHAEACATSAATYRQLHRWDGEWRVGLGLARRARLGPLLPRAFHFRALAYAVSIMFRMRL